MAKRAHCGTRLYGIHRYPDPRCRAPARRKLEIVGLAVNSSLDVLLAQAREFGVRHLAVGNAALANDPRCDEARALVRSLALPEGQEGVEASFGVGSEAVVLSPNCPRWMSS